MTNRVLIRIRVETWLGKGLAGVVCASDFSGCIGVIGIKVVWSRERGIEVLWKRAWSF